MIIKTNLNYHMVIIFLLTRDELILIYVYKLIIINTFYKIICILISFLLTIRNQKLNNNSFKIK